MPGNSHPTFSALFDSKANNFGLLRLILASFVVYSHSFDVLGNGGETFSWLTHGQGSGGGLALCGFFTISGLLIANSWEHSRGTLDYLSKRIRRIVPGYAAGVVFCLLIVGPLSTPSISAYFRDSQTYRGLIKIVGLGGISHRLIFMHNPMPAVVNAPIWTIRWEAVCYVLVVVLGLSRLLRQTWACLALFAGFMWLATPGAHLPTPLHFLARLGWIPWFLGMYFMAGVCMYRLAIWLPRSRILFLITSAAVLASLYRGMIFVMPTAGTYVLFYIASSDKIGLRSFTARWDLSYGIYVYAFPIQQLLSQYAGSHFSPYSMFIVALSISAGMAMISWTFIEKPMLRRKSRRPNAIATTKPSDGSKPADATLLQPATLAPEA